MCTMRGADAAILGVCSPRGDLSQLFSNCLATRRADCQPSQRDMSPRSMTTTDRPSGRNEQHVGEGPSAASHREPRGNPGVGSVGTVSSAGSQQMLGVHPDAGVGQSSAVAHGLRGVEPQAGPSIGKTEDASSSEQPRLQSEYERDARVRLRRSGSGTRYDPVDLT